MNNQDRFESEIRSWLREQAPRQAPEGLLARGLAAVRQTSQHRAWLTDLAALRSVRLVAAGAVVVAGMLAAVVLLDIFPRGGQPVGPSALATASSSPSSVAPWTSLRWSAPVPLPEGASILELRTWRDGYVGVGQATAEDRYVGAVFTSADGLHWSLVDTGTTFNGNMPIRLVATDGELLAMGNPPEPVCDREGEGVACTPSGPAPLWASSDGLSWRLVNPAPFADSTLLRLAGGPEGFAVVGSTPAGKAAIWHSSDGMAWKRASMPALSAHAILMNVTAIPNGFVATGREGEPDFAPAGGAGGSPGFGLPAAWWSSDGLNWEIASVEGMPAPGAQVLEVMVGATGLFAIGNDETIPDASPRTEADWTSSDGKTWKRTDQAVIPAYTTLGSDGTRIVMLGLDMRSGAIGSSGLAAWVSNDGADWTWTPVSGNAETIPGIGPLTQSRIDAMYVASDGLVVVGEDGGTGQVAWWVDASGG